MSKGYKNADAPFTFKVDISVLEHDAYGVGVIFKKELLLEDTLNDVPMPIVDWGE